MNWVWTGEVALFYSSVRVTVRQHVQHQDPDTEAAKLSSAIIIIIINIVNMW